MKTAPEHFFVTDDGIFPNSHLPILYYPKAIDLPALFPALTLKKMFKQNNWTNNWKYGVYTYHHYHSTSHEVLGVCKGETLLQLGGEQGVILFIEKGDVLVIPAGVAHINLGEEKDVICVGGYHGGRDYDIKRGRKNERPRADKNIAEVPLPGTDPLFGRKGGLIDLWK
jgi:uncharacterized protein YjlB